MALNERQGGGEAGRRGLGSRIGADLGPRAAAAVALAAAALACAWVGGLVFVAFWWIASLVVLWEWQRIVSRERLVERVGTGALSLTVAALLALHNFPVLAAATVLAGALLVGYAAVPGGRAWAGGGVAYAGALVVSLGLLRASPSYGLPAILWLFAVVWGADIAAYFAGRLIGGPKLWPAVSPGKTWSGAVVGGVAGALSGLLLAGWTNRVDLLFYVGLAAAVVSVLGDLFKSAVKRKFSVKDLSHLIPGHGGLMDRLDAFVAASVFTAVVAGFNSRGAFMASGLFQW